VLNPKDVKLDKTFNAFNLDGIADIKIIWTNNLADYLGIIYRRLIIN